MRTERGFLQVGTLYMPPGVTVGSAFDHIQSRIYRGEFVGEIGVLERTEQAVQCHVCGEWFKSVGGHAVKRHGITSREYRLLFGLRLTTRLEATTTRDLRRASLAANVRRHPEHRAAWEAGRASPIGRVAGIERGQATRAQMGMTAEEARERASKHVTHCVHGHEFTAANTIYNGTSRQCRTCNREGRMRRYYRQKEATGPAPKDRPGA